jgi:hypothetical protein
MTTAAAVQNAIIATSLHGVGVEGDGATELARIAAGKHQGDDTLAE